jgi:hypothetical protein
MHHVLGVEYARDCARAIGERGIQRLWLALRPAVIEHHFYELGVAPGHAIRNLACSGIIASDDDEHLEVRMIALDEARQRRLEHRLLVASWNDQRKRERGLEIGPG